MSTAAEGSAAPGGVPYSRRVPLIVAAAFFMENLDGSIVVTALPAIAHSFHRDALTLTLSISAYLVAYAIFVPTAGWASERYGARQLFTGAIGVFTLTSVLCAMATGPWTFIAARILQGSSAAFMSPVGRVVVLRETPKQFIIEALGMITWPALIAPVVGPPLAGLLTTYASWRWIFLLNVPLGLIGIYFVLRWVPRHAGGRTVSFDRTGFLLTAVALAALVQGMQNVSNGGMSPTAATLLIGGVVCALIAIRHALRHPAPLLDLSSVRLPTFTLSVLSAGWLTRIAINATPFLLPLMFQFGFGMNAAGAGLMVLVYMVGNLAMKSITTPTLRRYGFSKVLLVNGALGALSIGAIALLSPATSRAMLYAVLLIAGMTRSMNFTTVNTLAFADVTPAQRAGAASLSALAQQLASTFAVTITTLGLAASQRWRGASALALPDFQWAFLGAGLLMAAGTLWMFRLPADAGAEISQR